MIRFNNDYNRAAHARVLQELNQSAGQSFAGYGEDEICARAAARVRQLAETPEAAVYFLPGATQANFITVTAALSPVQSVICADSGHIWAHEAASIEHAGRKLLPLPQQNGKITAGQIRREASRYFDGGAPEYLTEPHLVYISFATEWGTLYSLRELEAISAVCREYNLLLFVDGARMGYALGAEGNDVTLRDFGRLADAFYIGGTKCGALFGEALVLTNKALQRSFKTYMKQNGAVLAKGWLIGLQFDALLRDGLYFDICARADRLADKLRAAFAAKGLSFVCPNTTNQIFVVLTEAQKAALSGAFTFEDEGDCVRFCTAWSTTEEEAAALCAAIERL